ncbi:MAG TPA: hypothetical protein VED41_04995, partial [Solirubrobacteraceae bacterium]|nr:hypothetical protein [Solirubrobacteraceae bacterium]
MQVKPGSVLLVTPRWTRDGGVATHAMASAEVLAGHGLQVHVLAARVQAEPTAGVTVHHSPDLFNGDISPERRVGDAIAAGPEVVHLHQFYDPDILALLHTAAPL